MAAMLGARATTNAPSAGGNGAFATGKYRNLFAELDKSPTEIRQKIDSAFQHTSTRSMTTTVQSWYAIQP